MKTAAICIFHILLACSLHAQKKLIDYSTYEEWPYINGEQISSNGKYITYTVGSIKLGSALTIQATNSTWNKKIPEGSNAAFTSNSRYIIFNKGADNLGILETGKEAVSYIPKVNSFKVPANGKGNWVAYQTAAGEKKLVLKDLGTGHEISYNNVDEYTFNDNGQVLLIQLANTKNSATTYSLIWVDLKSGIGKSIWAGSVKATNITFSKNMPQLVFMTGDGNVQKDLYYYKAGMDNAVVKAGFNSPRLDTQYTLSSYPVSFSENGEQIFFEVSKNINGKIPSAKPAISKVAIWKYRDKQLQTAQSASNRSPDLITVANTISDSIHVLGTSEDDPLYNYFSEGNNRKYMLVSTHFNLSEMNNALAGRSKIQLVSTTDGKRVELKDGANLIFKYSFSPRGNYVIWWSSTKKQFFTYDIKNEITRNITQKIGINLYDELYDKPFPVSADFGIAGWLENETAVLIYDRYDIWQVDPQGVKPPVNLTNGYGRRNNIVFRYINTNENESGPAVIKLNASLLLTAFNRQTKDNGFYNLQLPAKGDPEKLTMGSYIYYVPQLCPSSSFTAFSNIPQKAKNKDVYLVRRMSASEAPNLFVTKDFRSFTQITNIHPEKQYNWLTSSLVNWQTFDGKEAQGILYKPENFDSTRRYPVIFYFYERLSDGLNNFPTPLLSEGTLLRMLPYFVSQGYLVFIPDIYYKIGTPGESAYNYVVSAANKLAALPFVDKTRMGMQGHSFGGYQVNYLVTRTSLFAAAASAAGASDYVSGYGSLFNNQTKQAFYEQGQSRIGATLWEQPSLYIQNSPLFGADKVSTPLLIVHNKNDEAVTWSQALEWFSALRRLGKKAWLLQYEGADHTIDDPKQQLDYSIRLTQFFNHYLKGSPPPRWMTTGTDLDLDTSGIEP